MNSRLRPLSLHIHGLLRLDSSFNTTSNPLIYWKETLQFSIPIRLFHQICQNNFTNNHKHTNPVLETPPRNTSTDQDALKVETLLKNYTHNSIEKIEQQLEECNVRLSEDLILNVLERHRSDWKPAYALFKWVSKTENSIGLCLGASVYNRILDTLGRMRRFEEFHQVLDEMSKRKKLINEYTYAIVVNRLAAAHKVDEAIEFFNKTEDYGLEPNLIAFQRLLLSLCRYKHVEAAELLFRNKKSEFRDDIKTWNIILNGWCLLRSLPDAKRFWKDIIRSNCKPDKFTYGIFINSFCKSGKITTAMKLLKTMWEKGCMPDTTICNTVIDGLCFKNRIPEALEILNEMNNRDCPPDVATYNSLLKHMCKIRRMEKVDEIFDKMVEKGENCSPNSLTYIYLLKAAKKPEEVDKILVGMKKNGCEMESDTYNVVLKLFMEWGDTERVKFTWDEMERKGVERDQRSYTIMIHGLYDKGLMLDALEYFDEMIVKGMVPQPRTELLVDDMKCKLNKVEGNKEVGLKNRGVLLNLRHKRAKKKR